jgi:hypothetical protein
VNILGYIAAVAIYSLHVPNVIVQLHCNQKGRSGSEMMAESRSELRNIIGETAACVDSSCKGWLVDSFSGKYWIKCSDPKHTPNKIEKRLGEVNKIVKVGHQPTPGAEDALLKTTATQPTKLGSVIKWNIQQS